MPNLMPPISPRQPPSKSAEETSILWIIRITRLHASTCRRIAAGSGLLVLSLAVGRVLALRVLGLLGGIALLAAVVVATLSLALVLAVLLALIVALLTAVLRWITPLMLLMLGWTGLIVAAAVVLLVDLGPLAVLLSALVAVGLLGRVAALLLVVALVLVVATAAALGSVVILAGHGE